ncbi:MAG TPA: ATP-binding protein [Sediminibacterium sp.]|uniref:ATP-binding protein n=1 Tax=Sediminibacterium sp. TaxID=1917865 RepID=UPI002CF2FB58|nr:ATP-binding protein [Sediminibacterium sp.]HQS24626.1 ATP-binding protein [Sediminibacterium sp.]HQS34226.1 ATP-binding protein [Sediminibacterium sp.]
MNKALNDDTVYWDKIINHFGDDLSQLPIMTKAIQALIKKARLLEKPKSRNGKPEFFIIGIMHPRTIQALLSGNKRDLNAKPVKSFVELLELIDQQIHLKDYDTISGEAMHNEVESLFITNKHFREIQWLKKIELSTAEKLLLFQLVSEAFENIDLSNLPELIKKAAKNKEEANQLQNCLLTGASALLLHDLIELEPNQFMQCELGSLSKRSYEQFFHEGNLLRKKTFYTRVSTLIESQKIEEEPLFFNAAVSKHILPLQNALLEENYNAICNKIKGTNKGFTLLFHGAPGTGKTALAKQLAFQTGRNLLMVDAASIRNMYVGESEKNIRRIFKEYIQAKQHFEMHPILLFNEADALIAKRISVNSSVDQMNNAMQNILLQYLEDFEGVFIATTNLASNLDEAFNRRFLYKVEFKNPDKEVRLQIMQHHYPNMPLSYLQQLNERYALSGAQFVNINKKMLVEQLLYPDLDPLVLLEQLCAEERMGMGKQKAQPIGFMKRA